MYNRHVIEISQNLKQITLINSENSTMKYIQDM